MTDNSRLAAVKGAPHADALSPGTRLAEFEILSLLGVGGFGVVYKAFDHSLHRAVAIKEYLPLTLAGRQEGLSVSVRTLSDEQAFQSGLQSFVGEARLLAQFDHPSLVKVFRFWEAHNTAYMVMPLYNGMTLKQARAQMRTPPPEAWLRQVLWSVLGALRTLHESGTLHRDISPDNIFLQDLGPPVLLDLGAARHAINDRDHKHTAVLKVNYAPIEQYADGDADLPQGPWSDLYSLAAVVHGCLCNDTPLPSTLRSIRDRMVPFARVAKTVHSQFGQAYSSPLVAAVAQALALRPEDRPQSIDGFLQTMDMVSPPSVMDQFDFRAELGDVWVEPTDQPGPGFIAPTVDLSHALPGPFSGHLKALGPLGLSTSMLDIPPVRRPAQAADAPPGDLLPAPAAAAPLPPAFPSGPPADQATQERGGGVFLKAGESFVLSDRPPEDRKPPEDAAPSAASARRPLPWPTQGARTGRMRLSWPTALAALALAVAAAALAYGWRAHAPDQPPQDAVITERAEPPKAVPPSPMAPAAAPSAPSQEAPGASPVPAPAAAGLAPAFVEVPSQAAPKSTGKAAAPQGKSDAPVAAAPAAPRQRPQAARQLCADTNFFTRSACVYSECAKPAHAALPLCVEHRRRLQKQADNISGN